jgi:hypothetical protein
MRTLFFLLAFLPAMLCIDCAIAAETNLSNKNDTANSIKDLSARVEAGYSNFIPTVSNAFQTAYGSNAASQAAQAMSTVKTNVIAALNNTSSALPEIGAGSKYMLEMKKEGRLPGFPKDKHGMSYLKMSPAQVLELKYPFSIPFDVVLEGDTFTNHYTMLRLTKDSAWKLERAWRTDTNGDTIIEWPTK